MPSLDLRDRRGAAVHDVPARPRLAADLRARKGYFHFVLYLEPPVGPGSAINATQSFRNSSSRYAAEWLGRLDQCEPDALHLALVGRNEGPSLWHPCVYNDPESPSAIAGDGCVCWQTYRDPETWLPVAAHHYRTVSGNIEHWDYKTYAPLSVPAMKSVTAAAARPNWPAWS